MKRFDIYINNERLDLFEDETVQITSSVQNINDISKIFSDYSQTITVPASPNNNRIFKHYYNSDIDNGFDARITQPARIEIGLLPFKDGLIRLDGSTVKDNRPVNYKITYFSNLVNLKEAFGDDDLSQLDLSTYNHEFNYANLSAGIQTSLLESGNIIYPLISTTRRWYYNSNNSDLTNTDTLVNIAYNNGGSGSNGIKWEELKPAIKVQRLLEAIEDKYNITLDSPDVFDSSIYSNLFLFLGRNKGGIEKTQQQLINWNSPSTLNVGSFNTSQGVYTVNNNLGGVSPARFQVDVESSDGVPYEVELRKDDIVIAKASGTNNKSITKYLAPGQTKGEYSIHITNTASKVITNCEFLVRTFDTSYTYLDVEKTANQTIPRTVVISDQINKIKVREFFSGLLKMHNLVIIPNSESEFYINTLDNWYDEGNEYDITKYINTDKETPVKKGKILSNISYLFKEPKTFLATEYKNQFGKYYGDLEAELTNEDGVKLDGEPLKIELPFENMVYERLTNENTGSLTNVMYGLLQDEKQESTTVEGHLFYANLLTMTNNISLLNASGVKQQVTKAWTPFHTNTTSTETADYSTTWGADLSEFDSFSIDNNLYNVFYSDYITDAFDIKRRVFEFEAKFPEYILTKIKLNDKLIIAGRRYKINEMNINLTNNITKLELLNDL